ncbi:hypothetical protein HGRIS_010869 [Hohenbuehelia grisea]|uniref:Uncharacterized protein n=1 Tax=Hohenbuehelia grisea TaxID=104357 RepID=A0ABR3IY34_9AGAR
MTDQCAVGSDGQLLDANMIPWFNDPDDARPISAPVANGEAPAEARSVGNSRKLHDALHAEKHDEFGNMTKHMKNSSTSQARRKKPSSNQTLGQVGDGDTDDSCKEKPDIPLLRSLSRMLTGKLSDTSYFKCYHGNRKVLKITKAMKHNTVPLVL